MIFSQDEERKLREFIRNKDLVELKRYKATLENKLKEAENAKALYAKLLPNKAKLDARNRLILAGLQDEFPKIEDLNSTIKRIQSYQNSINTLLVAVEKRETPLPPPQQSKKAGKVSALITGFENKIRQEYAATQKLGPKAVKSKQLVIDALKEKKETAAKKQIHPNILSSVLRNGALLSDSEVKSMQEAVSQEKAAGRTPIKIKRTRDRSGAKYDKLSDLEKRLKLKYSVVVIPPEPLKKKATEKKEQYEIMVALYKGKAQGLGAGQYGNVKIGQIVSGAPEDIGEWVAVKIEKLKLDPLERAAEEIKGVGEREISKKVGLLKGQVTRPSENPEEHIKRYSALVLLKGHSLEYYLDPDNQKRKEKEEKMITDFNEKLDMVIATLQNLKKLHDMNILHRDLHPGNFMYDPIKKEIVIIDFGGSAELKPGQTSVIEQYPIGLYDSNRVEFNTKEAEQYIAQHGTRQGFDYHMEYSKRSDIFSMGYTIGNILTNYGDDAVLDSLPMEILEPIMQLKNAMINQNPNEHVPSIDECVSAVQGMKAKYKEIMEKEAIPSPRHL